MKTGAIAVRLHGKFVTVFFTFFSVSSSESS